MASQYTDQQRTRIYTRDTQNTTSNRQKAIGQTQLMTIEKEGLFDGISLAQIIAGAAAAATSMVLASKIGIGGSVIGAAVSSVVTVVSSQLYRKFLTASAQKLKNGKDALGDVASSLRQSPHEAGAAPVRDGLGDAMPREGAERTTDGCRRGARVAPASLQAKAAAERHRAQYKVIAFSIGIAIVAVVLSATAIFALTAGEGLGEKTEPIIFTAPVDDTPGNERDTATKGHESTSSAATADSADTTTRAPEQNTQANPPANTATDQPASNDTTSSAEGDSGSSSDNATGDDATGEDQQPSDGSTGSSSNSTASNSTGSTPSATGNASSSAA